MKLVSTYLKSAFIAVSIFLPITHANGMSYLSKWFSRTPQITEEAAKKEAVKVVEHVVEKTTPGQYAAQGALAVARIASNTVVNTAEFALNHPKLSLITGAGIYAYLNRENIKKKLEEYKPYLKVAGAGVAVAGAVIAGKNLHDLWKSNPDLIKLLLGSGSDTQLADDQLSQLKAYEEVWKQAQPEQRKESAAVRGAAPVEEVDYGALWDECQELQNQEVERARVENENKKLLAVQEAAWKEAEHVRAQEAERARVQAAAEELEKQEKAWQEVVQRAEQERSEEMRRKKELEVQEAAWRAAESARESERQKELAAQAKKQEEAKKEKENQIAPASFKFRAHHIPGLEPRHNSQSEAIYGVPHEETSEQFARRFTHGCEDELRPFGPRMHHVYVPQQVIRDANTPWVEEFEEFQEAEEAKNAWAQEFKQHQDANEVLQAMEAEIDAEQVAVVSDTATFGAAQDARDLRNLSSRYEARNETYESHTAGRTRTSVLTAQDPRVRITYQSPQQPRPNILPAEVARVEQWHSDYIPTPIRREVARIPARL